MPQTLLLADDSVTIQRVIELTFADEDINVVAVSDGDQAIERIEADPPDIVLVDIGMPGRSGYEVAHHIKQSAHLQHIPVLLLTGAFEPVDQAKAMAAGCDGVLAKPFEPQLVIARVRELLGKNAPETPPAEASVERPPSPAVADLWAPAIVEPAADPSRPPEVAHLDNYFAKLDAAFSTLESAPAEQFKTDAPLASDLDWFNATPDAPPASGMDLPLSIRPEPEPAAPVSTIDAAPYAEPAPQEAPQQAPQQAPQPAPVAAPMPQPEARPARSGALPPLADAFAAILAAEQHEPMPAIEWPASPMPPAPASENGGPSLDEDAIEEITRRVLDRLSDRIVRETVGEVVSHVAERLVRDEIERIKAAIE